ncbi:DUF4112 domain-containing protein [Falsirhodobacter sp. 20TX0035]|uniref:DUF4112 domain-containing protein n=1 Tax=Falsirhodobacter sp. 20TX0035 TaxID=3022019 RepID=UPI00232FBD33|nr:DUF4112 domain-containing protein [Falsirhodobacter sp. 20TX0035]MDB6452856.1 DUF4112 domain-containing protein [Falsirhodobacter sp. 20TX0035]
MPTTRPVHEEIARLDRLAHRLDSKFRMPLLGFRFGWDGILGLIPGLGDAATALPSALIIHRAWKLGLPRATLARMALNTGADFAFGSIPVLGSVFDIYFKANLRNIALIRRHLEQQSYGNKTNLYDD